MVPWKAFAQRRKLNLDDFVQKYSYIEFTNWCLVRGVDPPGSMAWQLKHVEEPSPQQETLEIKEPEVVVMDVSKEDLTKMTKNQLLSLCSEFDIPFQKKWSKSKIISTILD
mgnify:CR=1 FL=1